MLPRTLGSLEATPRHATLKQRGEERRGEERAGTPAGSRVPTGTTGTAGTSPTGHSAHLTSLLGGAGRRGARRVTLVRDGAGLGGAWRRVAASSISVTGLLIITRSEGGECGEYSLAVPHGARSLHGKK